MQDCLDEIREWLDRETKAILCHDLPDKAIASATMLYSLLLIDKGEDEQRIKEVVSAIRATAPPTTSDYPFVVGQQMTLEDAPAGQFALACCDCVTAFVRDEIVDDSAIKAFRRIHSEVMKSPEFERIVVQTDFIPDSEQGRRFGWQFFGLATGLQFPTIRSVYRKKARLMEHWAKKAGVTLLVRDKTNTDD
jgi:hypothetical protein